MSGSADNASDRVMRSGIHLKGPVVGGIAALALAASALTVASTVTMPVAFDIVDAKVADRKVQPVVHSGGKIAEVHVSAGQAVSAGDLLATIESGDLDNRIAAMKARSDAAQLQLQAVRREAQAFNTLLEQRLVSRQRVTDLERQVVELEREASALLARASAAETEIFTTEIRAPVSGIVRSAAGLQAGRTVSPGEMIAEIAQDANVVVFEAQLTPAQVKATQRAGHARVWLGTQSKPDALAFDSRLSWLSLPVSADQSRMAWFELVRAPGDASAKPAISAHGRVTIAVPAHNKTLLRTLLEPIRRGAGLSSAV